MRRDERPRRHRRGPSAGGCRLVAAAVALVVLGAGCGVPLPRLREQPQIPPLPQTSLIFDARGRLITRLHAGEDRTLIPLAEVPAITRAAVLAMEDERYYMHRGIDLKAILRAAYWNARSGRIVQGGSTITEQLIKNTITGSPRTLSRKVREAALALQLEKQYTKAQILEMYLNTVYFGQGAYGIQAASRTYFSLPASRLDLNRSATLAGLIGSPATYDPVFYPELGRHRRDQVLRRMYEIGAIDRAAFLRARAEDLELDPSDNVDNRYPAPYFVDYVKGWFLGSPEFGATREDRYALLFEGGLRIHTTVDLRLQREAERAISSVLVSPKDPRAAMTVLDPRTGEIKAMVGGRDFFSRSDRVAKLNLATGGATGRQVGSAFKPFALVTALQQGVSPLRVFPAPSHLDIPLPPGSPDAVWPVDNYGDQGYGALTLEQATIHSVNTVYAQLIMDVGPANVVRTAHAMGVRSYLRPYPSAVLGTNEVNTLEMASAYGTLATMGSHADPVAVTRITDSQGNPIYRGEPRTSQVIDPQVAWTTDQILQKVVQEGTARAANLGRPAAGKTGTAQDYTNAWFVGFVPQLVAAVWVGFPQRGDIPMVHPRVRIDSVTGGSWPAQIWRVFMVNATRNLPPLGFPRPSSSGTVSVRVDVLRHCLPTRWALPTETAVLKFLEGAQPTRICAEPSDPQVVGLPSVVGMSEEAAVATLRSWGFQVATASRPDPLAAEGTTLDQYPPAGTRALQGTIVTVVTSTGPSQAIYSFVPDTVGLDATEAIELLGSAGFFVRVIDRWQCDPPTLCGAVPDQVWFQDPGGGAPAAPGSVVVIRVNRTESGGTPPPSTPSPSPSPGQSPSPSP